MAILQSTTISGSINDTGSLQITGSTFIPPQIESALTSSFTASGLLWVNADNFNLQYTTETSKGTIQSPASFMGAWSAGGLMPANRCRGMQAVGVQNAALAMGGVPQNNGSDEYNGTSWASAPTMTCCGFQFQAAGTQDAALAMGMYPARTQVVSYNGSSWTTSTGTPVGVRLGAGGGFQNAAWVYGLFPSTTATLHWNGSSWSSNATIGLAGNQYGGGVGTIGAALSSGASGGTYAYDGVVWSQSNPNNSGLNDRAASGQQDAAVYAAGRSPQSQQTEEWNGMSWVRACDIPVATDRGGGLSGGNSSADAGLAVGGYLVCQAYEYTKNDIVPYTTCVWSSGAGNLFNAGDGDGAGSANAALSFGGIITPSRVSCTQEYEGTSWVVGGAMINAGSSLGGNGTMNAALAVGGEARCACTEEYNGSSWSTGGALNAGRYSVNSFGTQNSAIAFAGFAGPSTSQTCAESYNGTSWSTLSAMNCKKHATIAGSGTVNASIVYGGTCYTAPTSCQLNVTEEWDGSSWSIAASIINARRAGTGGGDTVNTALAFGGYNPSGIPGGSYYTELYDGVSWSNGANGLEVVKNSSGNAAGQNGAFSTMGNALVNSPYSSNNNRSQFYEAVCSTTMCSAFGAWSAAASMINSRYAHGYSPSGTQNSALASGGYPGSSVLTATEEYNGTAWSAGGALTEGKWLGGSAGTQNANLFVAGANPTNFQTNAQEYNGSSWSNITAFPTGKNALSGTGTEPAALFMGGQTPTIQSGTTEWNGSSYSAGGSLIQARRYGGASGTQNAGLYSVGDTLPSKVTCVEEYDGSSWATGGTAITAVNQVTSGGCQYNAFVIGGIPGDGGTQLYNGAAWEQGFRLPKNHNIGGVSGTQTNTLFYGGFNPSAVNSSFEFTCTLTGNCSGAWSFGGSLINARNNHATAGTQNAAVTYGGQTPSLTNTTEEYDGTSWSAGGAMSIARDNMARAGTQNAALGSGGSTGAATNATEEYDGSVWSAGGSLITARNALAGTGLQDAAIATGGRTPTVVTCTEEYDGSSWSTGGSLITGRRSWEATGTQNAAVAFGGYSHPTYFNLTEEYDGTSWSASNPLLNCVWTQGAGGTQNATVSFGGNAGGFQNKVEEYNGIGWTTSQSLGIARGETSGTGTQVATLAVSGLTPSLIASVEEFTCNTLLGAGLTYKRNEVTGS